MGQCESSENQIRYQQQQEEQIMLQNKQFNDEIARLQSKIASFEGMSKEIKFLQKQVVKMEAEKAELTGKLAIVANHKDHGHHDHMDDECECPFGQHQSPINIVSDADGVQTVQMGAGQHKSSPLEFSYPHRVAGCTILNNGYTVQINIGEQDTNPCTVTVEGVKYTLRQFHFHTPSEHTLDDRQYEMEMHLVHTTDDGNIAVLGYIFSVNAKYQRTTFELSELRGIAGVGDEEDWDETTVLANGIIEGNDFLKQFWSQLPAKKCAEIPLKNDISFDHLFEASSRSVKKSKRRGKAVVNMDIFQYDGSLTTPPYSEGVKWMVSKSLHFINQKQLRQLSACWGNKNNARDCQEYFDRKVQIRSHMTMRVDQDQFHE